MLPVELLISEHRLILHMVSLIEREIERIATENVKPNFIVATVDFFRTYADRYHHGKEEGILFKELSKKELSDVDHTMINELVMEHAYARRTVNNLERTEEDCIASKKDVKNEVLDQLNALVELYPKHIQKEDKQFFYPSMEYFTEKEQEDMLSKFIEFDGNFTNRRYKQIIVTLEDTYR